MLEKTEYISSPWDNSASVGLLRGFYQTWKAVVFTPTDFFSKINPKPKKEKDAWFSISVIIFASIAFTLCDIAFLLYETKGAISADDILIQVYPLIEDLIVTPLQIWLYIMFSVALMQFGLIKAGVDKPLPSATQRVVCYSFAPWLLMTFILPETVSSCILLYASYISFVGYREIHKTSSKRVLSAFAICVAAIAALIGVLFILKHIFIALSHNL